MMAYVIASEISISVDFVIWEMPCSQLFKLTTAMSKRKSDKYTMTRAESIVTKKLYSEIEEKIHAKQ